MSKTLRKQLYQVVSESPLKESAVEDFMKILHQADEKMQKAFLKMFKEDPTLAVVAYTNIKKKQNALQSESSIDGREILADEHHQLINSGEN